jgi:ribosomal protein S18 acetylase RimI-like enzyme
MQFDMQQRSYKQQYPTAESCVVMYEGRRIGKLYTANLPHSIVLVDVALLPEYRNRGIGTSLIRDLQHKAASAGKSVRLQVIESNSARQLYERLGFIFAGGTFPYVSMKWNCEQTKGED